MFTSSLLSTFPELQTERFTLRKIHSTDREALFKGLSDPVVVRYYGISYGSLNEIQRQLDWFDNLLIHKTGIWWAICYKDDNAHLIGTCGFNNWSKQHKSTNMGYWLLPSAWGKGIMSECVQAIIAYAFTHMDIHRIEAIVEKGNDRSSLLLRKLQFILEGIHRECEIKNGKYIDLEYHSRLNPDN